MKLALLGYGKMGKLIEEAAIQRGHQIACRASSKECDWNSIEMADLCIDFSGADAVIGHLEKAARLGKNVVIGTTGWTEHLDKAKEIVKTSGIGALYAPNFSLGVQIFMKILEQSAELINRFDEYGVAGIEFHHAQKKDAPSGTALEISKRMEQKIERIEKLNMTAVRTGSIPGKHMILFDSPFDTITICHEARSRGGFAKGAVHAAEWLNGKKGFFDLNDYTKEVFHGS